MKLNWNFSCNRNSAETGMSGEYNCSPTRLPAGDGDINAIAGAGCLAAYFVSVEIGPTGNGRGALPDPIDVMNHIGNIGPSAMLGSVAGAVVAGGVVMFNEESWRDWFRGPKKLRRAVNGVAATLGLVMNGLAESPFGTELHYEDAPGNYMDSYDFAYGVAATVIAARMTVRPQNEDNFNY